MCNCVECGVPPADSYDVRTLAWMACNWKMVRGQMVMVCPPGTAEGAMELRNRGMDLSYEVTYWPKAKKHLQTAGRDNSASELKVKDDFGHIGWVLQIGPGRAATWMEEWQKEGRRLAAVRERLLVSKPSIEKRGPHWTVRGKTPEGVYTSGQRKFQSWEQAVSFIKELEKAKESLREAGPDGPMGSE